VTDVLYLGTSPADPSVADALDRLKIGLMCQPGSNRPKPGWVWAADNGCFNARWEPGRWERWLNLPHPRAGCLFATVPDVVADHNATLHRWGVYAPLVAAARYPLAFVGQDGATTATVPWDELDCLFIGGSTEWKLSETAFGLAAEATRRGKWVHVGRVNSGSRFAAWAPHADSADGTFLAFGPSTNMTRLHGWIDTTDATPALLLTAGNHHA